MRTQKFLKHKIDEALRSRNTFLKTPKVLDRIFIPFCIFYRILATAWIYDLNLLHSTEPLQSTDSQDKLM